MKEEIKQIKRIFHNEVEEKKDEPSVQGINLYQVEARFISTIAIELLNEYGFEIYGVFPTTRSTLLIQIAKKK